jgi:hypothetical protein
MKENTEQGLRVRNAVNSNLHYQKFAAFAYTESNNDIYYNMQGITHALYFRLTKKSSGSPNSEIYRIDYKHGSSTLAALVINNEEDSAGVRKASFSMVYANDDRTTTTEEFDTMEIGGVGKGVYEYDDGLVYCKFLLSMIPLSTQTTETVGPVYDPTDTDTHFQGEYLLYPDLFCTTENRFPEEGFARNSISYANRDLHVFRRHGPILPKPVKIKGLTSKADLFYLDAYVTQVGDFSQLYIQ